MSCTSVECSSIKKRFAINLTKTYHNFEVRCLLSTTEPRHVGFVLGILHKVSLRWTVLRFIAFLYWIVKHLCVLFHWLLCKMFSCNLNKGTPENLCVNFRICFCSSRSIFGQLHWHSFVCSIGLMMKGLGFVWWFVLLSQGKSHNFHIRC